LLDPQDVDVINAALLAFIVEVVIDLARAHDHASDFIVGNKLDLFVRQQLRVVP
jgi:hypothetical protein